MAGHFEAKGVDSPRVVAEMLLAHLLQCERMRLYMDADRPASAAELAGLRELVARAARHEPVQYLVGHAWFFSRMFEVDRSTLIPRPCTELLVEHVLQWHRLQPGHANPLIADVGTGTGCIGISLAAQIGDARVVATDVVPEALELAHRNAVRHKVVDRLDLRLGSLTDPLREPPGVRYDAICSNLPYVPDHEWEQVEPNVKMYEPAGALRGGTDGLAFVGPLIGQAADLLKPGGLLALEIAACTKDAVIALAEANPRLCQARAWKDHEGLWRLVTALGA
jgi:release factor glutamine methyltransferase